MGRCKSCECEIVWAVTEKNKPMPLDALPNAVGNIQLEERPGKAPIARVLAKARIEELRATVTDPAGRQLKLYQSHFASCPNAKGHRRG